MSLEKRLQALEAHQEPEGTPGTAKVRLGVLLERHWRAGTLPLKAQEILCKAIARSPTDTPQAVIEALLARPELGEEHKDLLRRRQRGELLAWREN